MNTSTPKQEIRRITAVDTAKMIRKDLKANFPGTKFSVRTKTYSGGASIDVDWTNGPTQKSVETLIKGYAGSTFDGMQDLKECRYFELDGQKCTSQADFIFCERQYTKIFLEEVRDVCLEWFGFSGDPVEAKKSLEVNEQTEYISACFAENDHRFMFGNWTLAEAIRREVAEIAEGDNVYAKVRGISETEADEEIQATTESVEVDTEETAETTSDPFQRGIDEAEKDAENLSSDELEQRIADLEKDCPSSFAQGLLAGYRSVRAEWKSLFPESVEVDEPIETVEENKIIPLFADTSDKVEKASELGDFEAVVNLRQDRLTVDFVLWLETKLTTQGYSVLGPEQTIQGNTQVKLISPSSCELVEISKGDWGYEVITSELTPKNGRIPVKQICIKQGEGVEPLKSASFTQKDGDPWQATNDWIAAIAGGLPKSLGYWKTDFLVLFDDGTEYRGRLDLKRPDQPDNDNDLVAHILEFATFYSGRAKAENLPKHFTPESYRSYVEESPKEDRQFYAALLDNYQIG